MSDFYITLPSNSSTAFFPKNTPNNYKVKLPTQLKMDGKWEVGLAEIHFPSSWNNINSTNNLIRYAVEKDEDDEYIWKSSVLAPGQYDVHTLLSAIENVAKDNPFNKNDFEFEYNKLTNRVELRGASRNKGALVLNTHLAKILGYKYSVLIDLSVNHRRAPEEVNFATGTTNFIYVYTDVIESEIVGDIHAPLLRMVNSQAKYGETVSHIFTKPYYKNLSRHHIDTIEILIKDISGGAVSFEFGVLSIQLHFRRSKT